MSGAYETSLVRRLFNYDYSRTELTGTTTTTRAEVATPLLGAVNVRQAPMNRVLLQCTQTVAVLSRIAEGPRDATLVRCPSGAA